jgi:hypothetical protein
LIAGRDGIDGHPVAFLETADGAAEPVDDAHRFVAERDVFPFADCAGDGVGVGGADEGGGGADDGVVRTGLRDGLLHDADLADPLHDKGFHRLGHDWVSFTVVQIASGGPEGIESSRRVSRGVPRGYCGKPGRSADYSAPLIGALRLLPPVTGLAAGLH